MIHSYRPDKHHNNPNLDNKLVYNLYLIYEKSLLNGIVDESFVDTMFYGRILSYSGEAVFTHDGHAVKVIGHRYKSYSRRGGPPTGAFEHGTIEVHISGDIYDEEKNLK